VIVYRISKTQNIKDLSGTGARIFGGRWNNKGVPIIYASESRALATLEYLVHVPLSLIPNDLSLASIKIPDAIVPKKIVVSHLPKNWRDYPAPARLAQIGTDWIVKNETLLLRVPSAVVNGECNILLNPSHGDMKQVKISKIEECTFDNRLFKK
jgi:RES domain-containing protein